MIFDLYPAPGGYAAYLDGARWALVPTGKLRAFRRNHLAAAVNLHPRNVYAETPLGGWPPTVADVRRAEDAGAIGQPVSDMEELR